MKRLLFSVLLFLSLYVASVYAQHPSAPKAEQPPVAPVGSTSYNDHKRGTPRTLQYLPEGEDFVCVNGTNRYTRALYGSRTAWRLETSDRPIFATYLKRDSRNIRFRLHLPDGTVTSLEETTFCEARYTPGCRTYLLRHSAWGPHASLRISVLASPTDEEAVWKFSPQLPPGCLLEAISSPIRLPKLSRSGDMGADPPRCFDPAEDVDNSQNINKETAQDAPLASGGKGAFPSTGNIETALNAPLASGEKSTLVRSLTCPLSEQEVYISIFNNELRQLHSPAQFLAFDSARRELAGRIRITTPDPYLNTLGGALAVAADGIWGEEGVWLHGAIGWRMPLSGWRAAYTGDALGWHDRARTHFDNYSLSQVTDVPCTIHHPAQDSTLALARSLKQWGTPQYSNGYICRNPRRNDQMHHYDMNLCYIDELLWHFNWTGDLDYARRLWPLLTRHLAWERRNFDPDNDDLYDAYACIWASDALYYNSGAVTHSSAYNYRANRLAALIAQKIGEDPTPYRQHADQILRALNARLWLPAAGHWAEFQDFMGHRRLHESAAVWTIYHAIDSDVADPIQAYLATRYVDREIPHLPVTVATDAPASGSEAGEGATSSVATSTADKDTADAGTGKALSCSSAVSAQDTPYHNAGTGKASSCSSSVSVADTPYYNVGTGKALSCSSSVSTQDTISSGWIADWQQRLSRAATALNAEDYATIATTNWLPYSWSINNVAFAEVMHTALAYFQAGRPDSGYKLLKSSVLDGMYLGESPGNFGQISFYDAARGECYRDFGDPIGVASRVLIQGLYGILPDALNGRLLVKPGFPAHWQYASLHTPDVDLDFKTGTALSGAFSSRDQSLYTLTHHLPAVQTLELQFPAHHSQVAHLLINGQPASWKLIDGSVGRPMLSVSVLAAPSQQVEIRIAWEGELLEKPSAKESYPASRIRKEGPIEFVAMSQGQMKWWAPLPQSDGNEDDNHPATGSNLTPSTNAPVTSVSGAVSSAVGASDISVSASTGSVSAYASVSLGKVEPAKCVPVNMDKAFNASVTDIFRNEYLSPRSPYTTLQLPKQGIGEWCHPLKTADIDDSGLRAAVRKDRLDTCLGIPFRTPARGRNIAFTSLWDNYPDSLSVPLRGKASCAYLLMAGSTNHMQCHIDNALIRVYYTDGTCDILPLINPTNWPPIEQIFFEDGKAFNRHAPSLYRLRLKTGELSNRFGEELGFPGVSREVDGGAAVLLRMPLKADKPLSHLVLETLSNEVVVGLMGITLQR